MGMNIFCFLIIFCVSFSRPRKSEFRFRFVCIRKRTNDKIDDNEKKDIFKKRPLGYWENIVTFAKKTYRKVLLQSQKKGLQPMERSDRMECENKKKFLRREFFFEINTIVNNMLFP